MATDNNTILANVYLNATNDYAQRIGDPTTQSISTTMENLFNPMNGVYFNQFMDILINRIGFTYVRGKRFDNPLAVFKSGRMDYGSTIQEIAPAWVKAHSYHDAKETVFKMHRPEAATWYHSQNRQDYYPITINMDELRTAFTEEYGLNQFIARIMETPINSDNYDEYLIMKQLIGEYESRWGFFKYHLSAMPTNEDTGKEFLTAVRTITGKLKFPSALYNAADVDIPVFAKPSELVLLTTPEVQGSISVNVLSSIFNVELADINVRQITIDEFPIPNAVALLTTEDFFVCKDTLVQNAGIFNPETLSTNYFFHHWGVYSVSPFVPAILFTLDAATKVETIEMQPVALNLTADANTVVAGGKVQLRANFAGTITENFAGISVKPDSATYKVSAANATLNSRTYVDKYGVLHVQKRGIEPGDTITVTATSTYVNPSGATGVYTDTVAIAVVEPQLSDEYRVNYVLAGDSVYGVPSDGVAPAAMIADAGATVQLAPALTTVWTTSDGTDKGAAGTWTFSGWYGNEQYSGSVITKVDNIADDTSVYGKWEFA